MPRETIPLPLWKRGDFFCPVRGRRGGEAAEERMRGRGESFPARRRRLPGRGIPGKRRGDGGGNGRRAFGGPACPGNAPDAGRRRRFSSCAPAGGKKACRACSGVIGIGDAPFRERRRTRRPHRGVFIKFSAEPAVFLLPNGKNRGIFSAAGPVAQLVEPPAHNRIVVGSRPAGSTILRNEKRTWMMHSSVSVFLCPEKAGAEHGPEFGAGGRRKKSGGGRRKSPGRTARKSGPETGGDRSGKRRVLRVREPERGAGHGKAAGKTVCKRSSPTSLRRIFRGFRQKRRRDLRAAPFFRCGSGR